MATTEKKVDTNWALCRSTRGSSPSGVGCCKPPCRQASGRRWLRDIQHNISAALMQHTAWSLCRAALCPAKHAKGWIWELLL